MKRSNKIPEGRKRGNLVHSLPLRNEFTYHISYLDLSLLASAVCSPPQRFRISLTSTAQCEKIRVQCVFIIARAAADGPGPLKPREGECQQCA